MCRRSDKSRRRCGITNSGEDVDDDVSRSLPTTMSAMSSIMLKKHAQGCRCSAIKSSRHCSSNRQPSFLRAVPKMTTSPASSLAILRNLYANCRAPDKVGAAKTTLTVLPNAWRHYHARARSSHVLPPPEMHRMTGSTLLKFDKMSVCPFEKPS